MERQSAVLIHQRRIHGPVPCEEALVLESVGDDDHLKNICRSSQAAVTTRFFFGASGGLRRDCANLEVRLVGFAAMRSFER